MTRDRAIALLREIAPKHSAAHLRLPRDAEQALNWMPPAWAIEAVMKATLESTEPVCALQFMKPEAQRLLSMFDRETEDNPMIVAVGVDAAGKVVAVEVDGESRELVMLSEGGDLRDTLAG